MKAVVTRSFLSQTFLKITVVLSLFTSTLAFTQEQKPAFKNEYAVYAESEFSKKKVVVEWNSKEGLDMFAKAQMKEDFFHLAPYYQPQINPVYCGMASIVMLANYFRMKNPGVPSDPAVELALNQPEGKVFVAPYQGYSQLTFFKNPGVSEVKTEEYVKGANKAAPFDPGVNLDEFAGMVKAFGLAGEAIHVEKALKDTDEGFQKFIKDLKAALRDEKSVLVANFRGKIYGAPTGGHISPFVALYTNPKNAKDMHVLILDVAVHKNPWTWVPAKDLYHAMNSIDKTPTGEKYRGYMIISDQKK